MKKILFAFMLIANVAIAQPSVFHAVSFRTAEINEEVKDEWIWNSPISADFPVVMHVDTLILNFGRPYEDKKFINTKYKKIDDKIDGWRSTDEHNVVCWVYLVDEEDATYVRIEYPDHAYLVEIELYD